MNTRAQVTMDPEMRRRAHAKAARLGLSFAEYVRRLVAKDLGEPKAKPDISEPKPKPGISPDISIMFDFVTSGKPTNIARDKDKLVGEAVWQEYLQDIGH